MNTISNDQGNHVNAQNIARFIATGEKIPGNQAFKFVWRDFPLQQSSRLDKRKHVVSRAGREAGEYPLGTRYVGTVTTDVYSVDSILLRSLPGRCDQVRRTQNS